MTRWLALIFPLLGAGPAVAQNGVVTGSVRHDAPISVPEGKTVGDAARAISDRFALCIVQRHSGPVVKALAGNMAEQYVSLPKLMDAECFSTGNGVRQAYGIGNVELTTNPAAFRGALYKGLVQRKYARHPATFGPSPAALPEEGGPLLRFADCVARRDPAGSLQLLVSTAGSRQEQDAVNALQPQFGQCLPQGARLELSKATLVVFLAEAYYREAEASHSTGAD